MSLIAQHVVCLLQAVNHLHCRTIVKESRAEEDSNLGREAYHVAPLSSPPGCLKNHHVPQVQLRVGCGVQESL